MAKETNEPTPTEPLPGESFKPLERMVITSVEQLKALSDPLRMSLLELIIREALTVKQIATRLNQPTTKLYYHVAELEKAGFVTMVDTRVKSGIIEKYYRTSAENITVDHKLLNAGEDQESPIQDLLSVIFDTTEQEILRSVAAGLISFEDVTTGQSSDVVLLRSLFNFRKADLPRFIEKFSALLKELDARGDQPGPDSVSYACTIAFYPRVPPDKVDQE